MNEKQLLEALKQEIGSCGTRLFDLLIQRFEHLKEEHPGGSGLENSGRSLPGGSVARVVGPQR